MLRGLKILLLLVLLVLVAPWAMYGVGLLLLPEDPQPPLPLAASNPFAEKTWRSFGESPPIVVQRINPNGLWLQRACATLSIRGCVSETRGRGLVDLAAATLIARQPELGDGAERMLAQDAATLWISRHWSAYELLAYLQAAHGSAGGS